jgi:putative colanic acid biosynthesis UDP-glucose lipid carrier transferase
MFPQTRYNYLLRYFLMVTDIAFLNAIYFSAFFLTRAAGRSGSMRIDESRVIICNLIWLLCALFFGLYSTYSIRKLERIYRNTWRTITFHFVCFALYIFFFKDSNFSRTFMLVFYGLLCGTFIISRFIVTAIQYVLFERLKVKRKIAVLGSNATALRLSSYIKTQRSLAFYGFLGDDSSIYDHVDGVVSVAISEKLAQASADGVLDVYVAVAPQRMTEVAQLVDEADRQCIRLKFVPDLGGSLASPYTMSYLGGEFPIITLRHEPLEEMRNRFKKRVIDILFSSFVIVFILSWLYPIIAILIKLQSKGPVMFRQMRSGRNDVPFVCLKFRSMRVNDESEKKQASKGDSRITPIGQFLRKTSLDEMPQFFNVFLGHMSVVGPRPHMLSHTEQYKAIIGKFMVRHFLKPGITGWAQVNGLRGETKELEAMENRVKFDIYYLENWTSALDVKIIFMTIINAIRGEDNAF